MKKYLLIPLFIVAAFLRLYPSKWDSGQHLHPDERFLTMVGSAMQLPSSFYEYMDPAISTFNPANLKFDFFVYGIFPLIAAKLIATFTQQDTYDTFVYLGRSLSALADIFTLFFVFKFSQLLTKKYHFSKNTPFFATFIYATSVLPLQLSHFFTVDMFLNLFVFASLYFMLLFITKHHIRDLFFSAVIFGLGAASKISAVYILPLLSFLLFTYPIITTAHINNSLTAHLKLYIGRLKSKKLALTLGYFILFFLSLYITLRLTNPYVFSSTQLFDPSINQDFISDIRTLKTLEDPEGWFPPSVQWIHKPAFFYSFYNIVLFGLGPIAFFASLIGIVILTIKHRHFIPLTILLWTILFFLYQSFQFSKSIRYYVLLFPFFAFYAGIGLSYIFAKLPRWASITTLFLCLVWPVAFFSIYLTPHTRVSASHWIYNNISQEKIILTEHWDDPLPLPVENPLKKTYLIHELPVFGPDNDEKTKEMNSLLSKGDYLILSSNRAWGSIPTVPERYPTMTKYYRLLLSDKHPMYKKVKEFTSYPSLRYLGIPITISDDMADESFTVYDHPKVMIFERR